jgi:hypothetical protein
MGQKKIEAIGFTSKEVVETILRRKLALYGRLSTLNDRLMGKTGG